jgi:hypothetical protein
MTAGKEDIGIEENLQDIGKTPTTEILLLCTNASRKETVISSTQL